ncbi:Response regulator receiver domain-containing protein [Burkholderia sp. CF099]|nr:Response regulator receiver domain-containing protein [Burkholderia sp. CF099]
MPTVLLVDDDVETLDAWQGVCEAHGYATCLAEDGRTALDMLRERDVDVVVADWRMPVMSGSVLCHHVRHEQNLAEIVFILVSGEPSPPAFVYYDAFYASRLTLRICCRLWTGCCSNVPPMVVADETFLPRRRTDSQSVLITCNAWLACNTLFSPLSTRLCSSCQPITKALLSV